jgi:YVTN family beta-propeller protein
VRFVRFQIAAASIAAVLSSSALGAQREGGRDYVYVQSTLSQDVFVIDATTFTISAHIPVGDYTYDVIGSPDGRVAYVDAQTSSGNPISWQATDSGKIVALDTETDATLWTTNLDGSPQHMAISPDGTKLYVPLFDKNFLYVLDAKTGAVMGRWYGVLGDHATALTRDGRTLYVGNMLNDVIWSYDTASGRVTGVMRAGEAVRPIQLDADETHVIYQLSRFHGFKVRDIKAGTVQTFDLPALPSGTQMPDAYPFTVNHGLSVTPDHKHLLANGSIAGYVAIYSMPDYRLLGTVKVGSDPNWIAVRSDSKVAFVSNRGSGTLSVIDIENLKELKQIPVGKMPQRVSVISIPSGR